MNERRHRPPTDPGSESMPPPVIAGQQAPPLPRGVPLDVLLPALGALGADAKRVRAIIAAELERQFTDARKAGRPVRRSTMEKDLFRTYTNGIRGKLLDAKGVLEADAPDYLDGFVLTYDESVAEFERGMSDFDVAIPTQQRYSKKTKRLSQAAVDLIAPVRKYAGERIPDTKENEDLRKALVVGLPLVADAPQDNLTYLNTVAKVCEDPANAAIIEGAGLFPKRIAMRARPLAQELMDSIHDGVGGDKRRAEAAEAVNQALLRVEITLSRAAAWMTEFGAPDRAVKLEEEVSKVYRKRTSSEAGGQDQEDTKEEATPAKAPATGTAPAATASATPAGTTPAAPGPVAAGTATSAPVPATAGPVNATASGPAKATAAAPANPAASVPAASATPVVAAPTPGP